MASGITTNDGDGNRILNCTAYGNGANDIAWWDSPKNNGTIATILINNIAFKKHSTKKWTTISATNSWNLGLVPARESDFLSLDPTSKDFLKLSPNSRFIDKGTDIGYAYSGTHTDLGAFEYQETEYSSAVAPTPISTSGASINIISERLLPNWEY